MSPDRSIDRYIYVGDSNDERERDEGSRKKRWVECIIKMQASLSLPLWNCVIFLRMVSLFLASVARTHKLKPNCNNSQQQQKIVIYITFFQSTFTGKKYILKKKSTAEEEKNQLLSIMIVVSSLSHRIYRNGLA